jgi:hypothetical protein
MLNASGGPRMHRFTNNKTTTEQKITVTASGWWFFSSCRGDFWSLLLALLAQVYMFRGTKTYLE